MGLFKTTDGKTCLITDNDRMDYAVSAIDKLKRYKTQEMIAERLKRDPTLVSIIYNKHHNASDKFLRRLIKLMGDEVTFLPRKQQTELFKELEKFAERMSDSTKELENLPDLHIRRCISIGENSAFDYQISEGRFTSDGQNDKGIFLKKFERQFSELNLIDYQKYIERCELYSKITMKDYSLIASFRRLDDLSKEKLSAFINILDLNMDWREINSLKLDYITNLQSILKYGKDCEDRQSERKTEENTLGDKEDGLTLWRQFVEKYEQFSHEEASTLFLSLDLALTLCIEEINLLIANYFISEKFPSPNILKKYNSA